MTIHMQFLTHQTVHRLTESESWQMQTNRPVCYGRVVTAGGASLLTLQSESRGGRRGRRGGPGAPLNIAQW
jgi:hypothetical protein